MLRKTIVVRAGTLLAGTFLSFAVLAADSPSSNSPLVVPKGGEARHPTTEIAVGFGDVSHISPWRLKRRFPRTGANARSGQLVTLRDAMLAVNEFVAKDEEMPEHTFTFAGDGTLTSICDVPIAQVSVLFDGVVLSGPVREFPASADVQAFDPVAAAHQVPDPGVVAQVQFGQPVLFTLYGNQFGIVCQVQPGQFIPAALEEFQFRIAADVQFLQPAV